VGARRLVVLAGHPRLDWEQALARVAGGPAALALLLRFGWVDRELGAAVAPALTAGLARIAVAPARSPPRSSSTRPGQTAGRARSSRAHRACAAGS
jgi:hypothetical protein